jgi:hypothetical protein
VLAALSSSSIAEILLSIALLPFLAGYLIRRRRRLPASWLEAREGSVVLSAKGRARAARRGLDVAELEMSIDRSFKANEQGEIFFSDEAIEAARELDRSGRRPSEGGDEARDAPRAAAEDE